MTEPDVTVLLPVFNGALFLHQAIESILSQSFDNFELLIINDGSSDDSEKIIHSYSDHRINYVNNGQNIGLVATLNKGINLARGKYIARMDADDISIANRLKEQKEYLDQHSEVSFVASTINRIDQNGDIKGVWSLDQKTITIDSIRKTLIFKNCNALRQNYSEAE